MVRENFSDFIYGPLSEMNDHRDLLYWQAQTDEAKFAEAWRLVVQASELKGIKENELRLQRSIASFQRQVG